MPNYARQKLQFHPRAKAIRKSHGIRARGRISSKLPYGQAKLIQQERGKYGKFATMSGKNRTKGYYRRFGSKQHAIKASSATRKELINVLAQPDNLIYIDAVAADAPSSTAGAIYCQWFSDNLPDHSSGSVVVYPTFPAGSRSPTYMQEIAYQINSASLQDIVFEQSHFEKIHTITNQSNYAIRIEGFKLSARLDIPSTSYPFLYATSSGTTGSGDVSNWFAWALYNMNGTGGAANASSNTAYRYIEYDIFNFNPLLTFFKVKRKKVHKLMPGGNCTYTVRDPKPRVIRPNTFLASNASGTYYTQSKTLRFRQHETFWVFRVFCEQLGNDKTTNTNLMDIGPRVNMMTRTNITYKYIQDNVAVVTSYGSNITGSTGTVDVIQPLTGAVVEETIATGV